MDQGAFHRLQFAGSLGLLQTTWRDRSPLTPPLRKGHCEALRPPFPVEDDEPRLFWPWLGRTSTFGTDLNRLALTNEAIPVARSAGPRGGCPLVGAGSTAVPLTVSTV